MFKKIAIFALDMEAGAIVIIIAGVAIVSLVLSLVLLGTIDLPVVNKIFLEEKVDLGIEATEEATKSALEKLQLKGFAGSQTTIQPSEPALEPIVVIVIGEKQKAASYADSTQESTADVAAKPAQVSPQSATATPRENNEPEEFIFSSTEATSLLVYFSELGKLPLKDPQVRFHDSYFELTGQATFNGETVSLWLRASIEVVAPTAIRVHILQAKVGRIPIPSSEVEAEVNDMINAEFKRLTEQYTRKVDGQEMPGLRVYEIKFEEDKVRVRGIFLPEIMENFVK